MTAPNPSAVRATDWEDVKRRITAAIRQTEALLDLRLPDDGAAEKPFATPYPDRAADDDPVHALKIVSFPLSHHCFALDVRYVWEIVSIRRLNPLPGTPPYVRGVHDLRGQLLPAFDLRSLLDLSQDASEAAAWAIVCGESQPEFLVLADGTPEMREVSREELASALSEGMGGTFGQVRTSDGVIVLDGGILLSDHRLFLESVAPGADAREAEDEAP